MTATTFEGWCLLELMGHRKLAGYVTETTVAGVGFVRIDVPGDAGTVATQLYAPGAVYAITPITEDLARRFAQQCRPEPVTRWELPPAPTVRAAHEEDEDDEDDEDDEELDPREGGNDPDREAMEAEAQVQAERLRPAPSAPGACPDCPHESHEALACQQPGCNCDRIPF